MLINDSQAAIRSARRGSESRTFEDAEHTSASVESLTKSSTAAAVSA